MHKKIEDICNTSMPVDYKAAFIYGAETTIALVLEELRSREAKDIDERNFETRCEHKNRLDWADWLEKSFK